jgi:catechol 2,3-dioxygenase-like lactoylglutathione lyase family enzyme
VVVHTKQGAENMKIHRIDHVGIVVNDLPAAKAFFLDLGLKVLGEAKVEGAWVERIFYGEFDGGRRERVLVKIIGE